MKLKLYKTGNTSYYVDSFGRYQGEYCFNCYYCGYSKDSLDDGEILTYDKN